jgi:sigma-B regulation protein RsbU (phosphoserine phosphatase)
MSNDMNTMVYQQLVDRRQRLITALPGSGESGSHLNHLLQEVDAALERLDNGSYGLCDACHDPIETDRLMADPLLRFCLDHLNPNQQRSLEEDLELASRIQTGLLPKHNLSLNGWQTSYLYRPAGHVSGDYCDVVSGENNTFYFVLGDVSGKGIAASMLMAHLHAVFRTLISIQLPLQQLVARASRVFCESTLPTHYATLVCGRAFGDGEIEICNAGHLPVLVVDGGNVTRLDATGLPIGLFCNEEFTLSKVHLSKGSMMLLYTDGVVETRNANDDEYGLSGLIEWVHGHRDLPPSEMLEILEEDLTAFRSGAPLADDLSIMAIQRTGLETMSL